jgi:hypothetical protein
MLNLTSQQQRVLAVIVLLLLFGWVVRAWRLGHPVDRANGVATGLDRSSVGATTN